MHRLLPLPASPVDAAGLLDAYAYPADRTWLRANMVATVDGAAQGPDGRSASVSTPADRRVFAALRALADCVVAGAGTVRSEDYGPSRVGPPYDAWRRDAGLSAAPTIAVVTRTLRLDPGARLFSHPQQRPVVLTVESADRAARERLAEVAEVVVAGDDDLDAAAAVAALEERGFRRLLCEGGPQLLRDLVAADVLDELALTVSPLLTGGEADRVLCGDPLDPPRGLRLAGLLEEDGTLFARYQRDPSRLSA